MKKKNIFRLFVVITTILLFSLIIGNLIVAPIIIYYKNLVKFFGWLFLLLIIILTSGKFYANLKQIKSTSKKQGQIMALLKQTFSETIKEILQKSAGFIIYLSFLILIGTITAFSIWINSKFFSIQVK